MSSELRYRSVMGEGLAEDWSQVLSQLLVKIAISWTKTGLLDQITFITGFNLMACLD